jgi:hypothetical protein
MDNDVFQLLRRLTIERTGWRRYLRGRWYYAGDACRADAAAILRARGASFLVERGCSSAAIAKAEAR